AHPVAGQVEGPAADAADALGLQQLRLAVPEALLQGLGGGDVGVGADHAQRRAPGVAADHHAPVENPDVVATLAAHPVFAVVAGGAAFQVIPHLGQGGVEIVGVNAALPLVETVADLVLGVPQHGLPA